MNTGAKATKRPKAPKGGIVGMVLPREVERERGAVCFWDGEAPEFSNYKDTVELLAKFSGGNTERALERMNTYKVGEEFFVLHLVSEGSEYHCFNQVVSFMKLH
jgi:hypothetical protein